MPHPVTTTFVDNFAVDNFASSRYKSADLRSFSDLVMGHVCQVGTGLVFTAPSAWGTPGQGRRLDTEAWDATHEEAWFDSATVIPSNLVSMEIWLKWRDLVVGSPLINPGDFQPPDGPTNYDQANDSTFAAAIGLSGQPIGGQIASTADEFVFSFQDSMAPGYTSADPDVYTAGLYDETTTHSLVDTPSPGELHFSVLPDGTGTLVVTQGDTVTETLEVAGGSPIGQHPLWNAWVGGVRQSVVVEEIGWTMVVLDPGPPPPPPAPPVPPVPPAGVIQLGRISGGTVRLHEAGSSFWRR